MPSVDHGGFGSGQEKSSWEGEPHAAPAPRGAGRAGQGRPLRPHGQRRQYVGCGVLPRGGCRAGSMPGGPRPLCWLVGVRWGPQVTRLGAAPEPGRVSPQLKRQWPFATRPQGALLSSSDHSRALYRPLPPQRPQQSVPSGVSPAGCHCGRLREARLSQGPGSQHLAGPGRPQASSTGLVGGKARRRLQALTAAPVLGWR